MIQMGAGAGRAAGAHRYPRRQADHRPAGHPGGEDQGQPDRSRRPHPAGGFVRGADGLSRTDQHDLHAKHAAAPGRLRRASARLHARWRAASHSWERARRWACPRWGAAARCVLRRIRATGGCGLRCCCGGMLKRGGRERSVIIDTGPDFREQALRTRLTHVDAVLYTHSHADHIMGLDDLRPLSFASFRAGGPIPLYAAGETAAVLERIFDYHFSAESTYPTRARVHIAPLADRVRDPRGGIHARAGEARRDAHCRISLWRHGLPYRCERNPRVELCAAARDWRRWCCRRCAISRTPAMPP